jgi:hypothetical protein
VRPVGHRDPRVHRRARGGERFDERRERRVEKDAAICGVIDDVAELLGKKSRIDRVDHRAHARDRVVQLEVPVAVPGERGNAIAVDDALPGQRARELARSRMRVAIRVAMNRAFDGARDDLGIAVKAIRVADQRRDHQRHVHHQTVHRYSRIAKRSPDRND